MADEFQRAESFGTEILALCVKVGGTITGEHGVGIEKINAMCLQFAAERNGSVPSPSSTAFDPSGPLNPDKAIPTLRRCAEFGAMHVAAREERVPDLPRF